MDMIMRVVWWLLGCAMVAGVVLFVFMGVGRAEDLEHKWMLNLTIITSEGHPDKSKTYPMKSKEECWQAAEAWAQPDDIGKKDSESVGLGAGCGVVKVPSQEP